MKYIIVCLLIMVIIYSTPFTQIPKRKRPKRVVCSLTTRPKQPYYFSEVLDILVKQFDAVYLTIPKISRKGIEYPIISHPGVTIVDIDKDYGPITKYFGALEYEKDPDTLIVVVDDDIKYSNKLRSQYTYEHMYNYNNVITGGGIIYKYAGKLPWYLSMTGRQPNFVSSFPSFTGNMRTSTVCGYTGVAFRRGLIDKQELKGFIVENNKCIINDDIVISAYFANKNIKRMFVNIDDSIYEKNKDTESLSRDTSQYKFYDTQYKAYLHFIDCFDNDPYRYDCICAFDIFIILLSIQNFRKGGR
jgi:hypothetical protein